MHSIRMSSSTELRRSGESGWTVTVSGCSMRSTSPALGPSQLTAVGSAAHSHHQVQCKGIFTSGMSSRCCSRCCGMAGQRSHGTNPVMMAAIHRTCCHCAVRNTDCGQPRRLYKTKCIPSERSATHLASGRPGSRGRKGCRWAGSGWRAPCPAARRATGSRRSPCRASTGCPGAAQDHGIRLTHGSQLASCHVKVGSSQAMTSSSEHHTANGVLRKWKRSCPPACGTPSGT